MLAGGLMQCPDHSNPCAMATICGSFTNRKISFWCSASQPRNPFMDGGGAEVATYFSQASSTMRLVRGTVAVLSDEPITHLGTGQAALQIR